MKHTTLGFFFGEAAYEFRTALRGPLVPLTALGMIIYVLLIMLNADYMRQMGAIDVYRNSPHVTYLLASGQSLWMFFAWAWLIAQIIVRDKQAELHEVVLAAPISVPLMLFARFVGALGVAVLLGAASFAGILLTPVLVPLGALPADAIGPTPWLAFGLGLLVYTVPNAIATGGIYIAATLKTRSITGAFSAAATISLIWMVSMIVLRGGDVDVTAASVLDPAGYAETERQMDALTPAEKKEAIIAPSLELLLNRFAWMALGIALLGWSLARVSREQLIQAGKTPVSDQPDADTRSTTTAQPLIGAIAAPNWWSATAQEAAWHLRLSLKGFGFRLALVMLIFMGVLGSWVNFVGHADGPLTPSPQALMPFMAEFFYIVIIFVVVGFVGALFRRDDVGGYDEWVDAARAPIAVQLGGKTLAAVGLVGVMFLVPAISGLIVTALGAPETFDLAFPFVYSYLILMPSMLEVAAVSILLHALFTRAGPAYVVSIVFAFIAIINHEMELVQYPPAQLAIPPHADLSELTGWASWLPMLSGVTAFKLVLVATGLSLTWLAWRRGSALQLADRFAAARERLFGPAGATAAAAIAAAVGLGVLLEQRLVTDGTYESTATALDGDAAWETRWWSKAEPFSLTGGEVVGTIDPISRSAELSLTLNGLSGAVLHGQLPHGVALVRATADSNAQSIELDDDFFAIPIPSCAPACALRLDLELQRSDWPVEDPPTLSGHGTWLSAADLLPTLGHSTARVLRASADRRDRQLGPVPSDPEAQALEPLAGVAPAGDWRWSIELPDGWTLGNSGATRGPLDFSVVWRVTPVQPVTTALGPLYVAAERRAAGEALAADIASVASCVEQQLGTLADVRALTQIPRHLGAVTLRGGVLALPEDLVWDSNGTGVGSWQRLHRIGEALAHRTIADTGALRDEQGARWLLEGVASWVGLRCVHDVAGADAAFALRTRAADVVIESFSTATDPINTVADATGDWLADYSMLALNNWSLASPDRNPRTLLAATSKTSDDLPLLARVQTVLGAQEAAALLGEPQATDLVVSQNEGRLRVAAQRWQWQDGGWVVTSPPERVLLRSEQTSGDQWIEVGTPIEVAVDGYVLDAHPSFERSLGDNRLAQTAGS